MAEVEVTNARGVTLRGPLRLKLSKDQLARRRHLFAKARGGWVDLDGGRSVSFKLGERFGIEGLGKISRADLKPVTAAAPEPGPVMPLERGADGRLAVPAEAAETATPAEGGAA